MVTPIDKTYQVFLSYNSKDREPVQEIAVYLKDKAGLNPWFDQWHLILGEPWMRNLERGLAASSSCAVFIGRNGLTSWQQKELEAALSQQATNQTFRVMPVLLPGAPEEPSLSVFLSGLNWVDFRGGLNDDSARWRLECGILGIAPGSGRPRKDIEQPAQISPEVVDVGSVNLEIKLAERPVNIFISYRHHEPDSSLAHLFADALRKAGHKVFIDTGLRWGSDWVKGITEALERSAFLLLLLSKESGASEMVVKEVDLARELALQHNGAPVVLPVRLSLPFTEPLPYQLAINLHNIHQEVWSDARDTSRLAERLLATVANGFDWRADETSALIGADGEVSNLQPQFDPRNVIIPGGSIKTDSRFYIARKADGDVFTALQKSRAIVTVRGSRQTGKTSLIIGMYSALRRADTPLRTAFIDLQALEEKSLQSRNTIWCAIAVQITRQLQLKGWKRKDWDFDDSYDSNFSTFLDQIVFGREETPLLICLDEVDRLFSSSLGSRFFSSVRAFYNDGATGSNWERVNWLLGSSSEPSFFITDLRESPFNIGLRVELGAFTREEVASVAGRHGLSSEEGTIEAVREFVGGRPYLVHLLFYHLVRNPLKRAELFDTSVASRGIFRDHLHSYLVQFQREKPLAKAMQAIISGEGSGDPRMIERLEAAGLVSFADAQKVVPACRLYSEFFGTELK